MSCPHAGQAQPFDVPSELVCPQCVALGDGWVHLRMCLVCGQVGCCDSSPNRHATAHFHETSHPVMRSIQPGEDWRWCYIDNDYVD